MFVWLPRVSPLPNGVQATTSESFWLDLQNPWSSLFLVEHFLCWQPDRCTQIGAYPLLPFTAWRESQDTWFALSCWLEPPVCVSYQLRIPLEEAGRSWGASCLCLERLGALMSWRLQAGGMGDARDIIKSLEELIQRGHAEYLGTLWGWIVCVYWKCILDFTSDHEVDLTPALPPNGNQTCCQMLVFGLCMYLRLSLGAC